MGREKSGERMSTQESSTLGPENLHVEYESTLHWASVVNGAERQVELEHFEGAESPVACGRQSCSIGPAEPKHKSGSFKDLSAAGIWPDG